MTHSLLTRRSSNLGIPELLEVFERLMPNPTEGNPPTFLKGEGEESREVRVTADPADHVVAHVVILNNDPYKGRLAVFRLHQGTRSEEHTSELQSLMRISYAVFCLNKNTPYP